MLQVLSATPLQIDGFPLWVVLLLCGGVFLASFMDAIAGGGGIISVPAHLIAFGSIPAPYALGTNKVSAAIGTVFSTVRFIKNGYVNWRLFAPAIVFALAGSAGGTWLQHRTPDAVLKYLLRRFCRRWRLSPCGPANGPTSRGKSPPEPRRRLSGQRR